MSERAETHSPIPAAVSSNHAVLMLSFCCLCWGLSFPVVQFAIRAFESHLGISNDEMPLRLRLGMSAAINGWRFLLAAAFYYVLTARRQREYSRADILGGVWTGLFFGTGIFAQLMGLRWARPSISAFLTSLVVVFAPLAQAFLFRRRLGGRTWLAVLIAIAGMLILYSPNRETVAANTVAIEPPIPFLGEALTVLASLFFTGQLLAVDRYGQTADPARLTFIMFAVTGLLSLPVSIAFGAEIYSAQVLVPLLSDGTFQASMLSVTVFSAVVALHLMNVYQPRVAPATASVIYCLEPVFTTLFSIAFQTEQLVMNTVAGGAAILAAVALVSIKPVDRAKL